MRKKKVKGHSVAVVPPQLIGVAFDKALDTNSTKVPKIKPRASSSTKASSTSPGNYDENQCHHGIVSGCLPPWRC